MDLVLALWMCIVAAWMYAHPERHQVDFQEPTSTFGSRGAGCAWVPASEQGLPGGLDLRYAGSWCQGVCCALARSQGCSWCVEEICYIDVPDSVAGRLFAAWGCHPSLPQVWSGVACRPEQASQEVKPRPPAGSNPQAVVIPYRTVAVVVSPAPQKVELEICT